MTATIGRTGRFGRPAERVAMARACARCEPSAGRRGRRCRHRSATRHERRPDVRRAGCGPTGRPRRRRARENSCHRPADRARSRSPTTSDVSHQPLGCRASRRGGRRVPHPGDGPARSRRRAARRVEPRAPRPRPPASDPHAGRASRARMPPGFARDHHDRDDPLPRHRHGPHQGSVSGSAGSCLSSQEGDEASTNSGLRAVEPRRRRQHAESQLLLEHRHRIGRPSTGVLARIGRPGGATHRDDTTDRPSCGAMGLWRNKSRSRRMGLSWNSGGLLLGIAYAIPAALVVLNDVSRGLALSVGVVPAAVVGLPPTRRAPAGSSPCSVWWSVCRSSSARSSLRSHPSPWPW